MVPWMPAGTTLRGLEMLPFLRGKAKRLARRRFEPLADAPLIQGRSGEFRRLWARLCGAGDERLSYEANDWLMKTMSSACRPAAVTAVHSFEDCSLWQFEEAKRLGKACIYDLPIGYYPAWERTQAKLARVYADWLPASGLPSSRWVRPDQKRREMELADIVLVASSFVRQTIETFIPKRIVLAPYGVDAEFWRPAEPRDRSEPLRFIYAGQCSIRKGTPLLLEAWRKAALPDAQLELVGVWQLAEARRVLLPAGVRHMPPCSREDLRDRYRAADVFVFPSYFEGFGLVLLEAMACGLPAIASTATAGPDVLDDGCGRLVETGNVDALVEAFHWCSAHRERLPVMRAAARQRAEQCSWEAYRQKVAAAVEGLC